MPISTLTRLIPTYTTHQLNIALILCAAYIATAVLVNTTVPEGIFLNPATGLALATLYFGGLRLSPLLYLAVLITHLIAGDSTASLGVLSLIETAQAAAGAYLLRRAEIDPLFRRHRDIFYFINAMIGIALIAPALHAFFEAIAGTPLSMGASWQEYIANVACLIVVTPFILRWVTKPRFSRTAMEALELGAVFTLLICINIILFTYRVEALYGIPLAYILFIPLFWIALNMRPRFMTLALLITAAFSLGSVLAVSSSIPIAELLFERELFIIALAVIFFIITTLEEDRRVNTNVTRSQLATLTNVVSTLSSETKAKNDFIAVLAHELRNPLAPVTSSIEVLRLQKRIGPMDYGMLDMIPLKNTQRSVGDTSPWW